MLTALKKELRSAFSGLAPYFFGAVLLVVIGINTLIYCVNGTLSNMEYAIHYSSWILLILVPLTSLWMHNRLHAVPLSGDTTEEGTDVSRNPLAGLLKGTLWAPSVKDQKDAAWYKEQGITSRQRVAAVYIVSLLAIFLPLLVSLVYAAILTPYGLINFSAFFSELLAFFLMGSSFMALALCAAATQKSQLFSLIITAVVLVLEYNLMALVSFCGTPYSAMLLLTALIAVCFGFLYFVTKNSTLALLVAAVLEIVQVIFFVFNRESFSQLASRLVAKLSIYERFYTFLGGLMDLRALIYFVSVAAFLLVLALVGIDYEAPAKLTEEEEEAALQRKEKQPVFGNYPVVLPAIVLGCTLVLNILLHTFTGTLLLADVSGTGLFTPSAELKEDVAAINEDIDIFWIVQNGKEETSTRSVLAFYEAMSPRIHLIRSNPAVKDQVSFLTTYVVDAIYNNSLLIKSGEMTRFVPYDSIYGYETREVSGMNVTDLVMKLDDEFDHALEYFNGNEAIKAYFLTGHGETTLTPYFLAYLQREDISIIELSSFDSIPDDCQILVVNAPAEDLSDAEADAIFSYLENGGAMLLTTRIQATEQEADGTFVTPRLLNLEALMVRYGAVTLPGIVLESSSTAADSSAPYLIQPSVMDHEVTQKLISSRTAPVLSYSQGLFLAEVEGVTSTPLLLTSSESFSKIAGTLSTTLNKEEGDLDGPLALAAAIENADTRIVWVASASFLVEEVSDLSSNGNVNFLSGIMSFLNGGRRVHEPLDSKLYNMGTLHMTDESTASRMTLLLCFVFPFLYLMIGLSFLFTALYKKNKAAQEALLAKQKEEDERRAKEEAEKQARREALRKQREEATRAAIEAQKAKKKNSQK